MPTIPALPPIPEVFNGNAFPVDDSSHTYKCNRTQILSAATGENIVMQGHGGSFSIGLDGTSEVIGSGGSGVRLDSAGSIDIGLGVSGVLLISLPPGNAIEIFNSSGFLYTLNGAGVHSLYGNLHFNAVQAASAVGTLVGVFRIDHPSSGVGGYVPIYDSFTP